MSAKKWISVDLDQPHLLSNLEPAKSGKRTISDEDIFHHLYEQLLRADRNYPGGLLNYLNRARTLLKQSASGINPYDGFKVTVPDYSEPKIGSDEFFELEKIGLEEVKYCCFVLVAGGLGERLGFPDIKISLATNMMTKQTYIEYYFACIFHLQELSGAEELPVMIMTSGDTHRKTLELLESNNYFSLRKSQVKIVQQEKVPALLDNQGHIAHNVCPKSGFREIILKPHGHGDVHTLIYQNKLAEDWLKQKHMRWLLFFQDTNAMTFKSLPVFLGVSKTKGYDMNSLCIPRTPGEAVGAICRLTRPNEEFTLNVEYNQLDALLKGMGLAGDVATPGSTESPFPGNCNILLFNLASYCEVLNKTKGVVPEFVNPKYADESKTKFKSPTRVECMMQEIARLFDSRVGATVLPRWFCFSTVKNNMADAALKIEKGLPGECAFSGEIELYANNVHLLRLACERSGTKLNLPNPEPITFHKMTLPIGPRIVLCPSYALTLTELCSKVRDVESITMRNLQSSLVLAGDVCFKSLDVSGDVELVSSRGKVVVNELKVENGGSYFEAVDTENSPLLERVRGYKLVTVGQGLLHT